MLSSLGLDTFGPKRSSVVPIIAAARSARPDFRCNREADTLLKVRSADEAAGAIDHLNDRFPERGFFATGRGVRVFAQMHPIWCC